MTRKEERAERDEDGGERKMDGEEGEGGREEL